MTVYKLTDADGMTKHGTQWGEGVTHMAANPGNGDLCGPGWIHWYADPVLAVMMDPIHGKFGPSARMWEAETIGDVRDDRGLKGGSHGLTTLREIPVPTVTTEQRVRFGVLCALEVCDEPKWVEWARAWLANDAEAAAARAARAAANAAAASRASRAGKSIDLIRLARQAVSEDATT